jgi:hypothetical protein
MPLTDSQFADLVAMMRTPLEVREYKGEPVEIAGPAAVAAAENYWRWREGSEARFNRWVNENLKCP